MKKLILILSLGLSVNAFAKEGYLYDSYGTVVKDAFNECIHSGYFDKSIDGIAECNEAPVSDQKTSTEANPTTSN